MENIDSPRLVYLILLVLAVAGYFFAEGRQALSKSLQQALVWGMIFIGFIAGYGLWQDVKGTVHPTQLVYGQEGRIEVPRQRDGHYYLTAMVNGTEIDFVIDTGATDLVLNLTDAARIGISESELMFSDIAYTANGQVRTAPIRLDVIAVGELRDQNVPAMVTEGDMDISLLGMAYLERFAKIEISGNKLVLTR